MASLCVLACRVCYPGKLTLLIGADRRPRAIRCGFRMVSSTVPCKRGPCDVRNLRAPTVWCRAKKPQQSHARHGAVRQRRDICGSRVVYDVLQGAALEKRPHLCMNRPALPNPSSFDVHARAAFIPTYHQYLDAGPDPLPRSTHCDCMRGIHSDPGAMCSAKMTRLVQSFSPNM